ncbi:tetratricopeptide repeat protein [Streptomyces sp. NRRL S-118]|uniref:tetratricopeptide repeat protein n=1 Tax=Streptomyces sp. NRRL S-118 TaxID=1463881 RepID=UPI00099C4C12|nr:tetratricopeptide repeat protein [Streptomyces sp. NRRL S-118]
MKWRTKSRADRTGRRRRTKAERVTHTVLLAGAGAVVAGAVLVYVPGVPGVPDALRGGAAAPPAPGPAARAQEAVRTGTQASLPELTALIGDRERWLRDHPRDDASWAVLGTAYVERAARDGDTASYVRAEKALRRSLAVRAAARGNIDAQLGMAALAGARGDFARAKRWGEAVRQREPRRWQAHALLVDAYRGLGDYEAADKAVERLRALNKGVPALSRASHAYRDKGWREDAAALASDAVALAATPAERAACLQHLGDLAWERGEPAEALAHYAPALRLVPGHPPSLAGRARALAALGRVDDALRDYAAVLAERPLPQYALEAGELYESRGLDGDARAQYRKLREGAAEALAHGVNATLVLARYEADHGDPATAVKWLTAEWGRGHRSVDVADALGWALFRAGKEEEALKFAELATDQGVRSALFAYHRGQIERALGRYGPARRYLTQALRTNPAFSPLLAPKARRALAVLGEPPAGGPADVHGSAPAPARPAPGASAPASGVRTSRPDVHGSGPAPARPAPGASAPASGARASR